MRVILSVLLAVASAPAWASGTMYYGSRAGMVVDVLSMSGLDTAHAVIRTRHTRENAIEFCREYVGKVDEQCIREELSGRLNDEVTANCPAGLFTDFQGGRYRYEGRSRSKNLMAKYRLVDLTTGEVADGSSASGYPTNMNTFRALCPRTAPPPEY